MKKYSDKYKHLRWLLQVFEKHLEFTTGYKFCTKHTKKGCDQSGKECIHRREYMNINLCNTLN